jgi:DNA ligase (NAD+)
MKGSKSKLRERASWLREEIKRHNKAYYVDNMPVISDFEFDLLLQELQTIENKHPELVTADSPTRKIGSDLRNDTPSREFNRVSHKNPMLSLSNTYNKNELFAFDQRVRKYTDSFVTYTCELKIDGTAISLTYENSKLIRAVTRGDGSVGDDVTANVRQIKGIPLDLYDHKGPVDFEIRGEIYMSWQSFDKLNNKRSENDEPLFANPRNAAAGSLKLLDPEATRARSLNILFYSVSGCEEYFPDHFSSLQWAKEMGFPVSDHLIKFNDIKDVVSFIETWETKRAELAFPIDGMVIKVNDFSVQKQVGFTSKFPRWAVAYKFKAQQVPTRLLSVDYQVGRTGAVTPVANLEPVLLAGTVVKRASLHNEDQMNLLDIHLGDTVLIEKGGEIIPKIVDVDISARDENSAKAVFPDKCPDCGTRLMKIENEARHYCPNSTGCPMQIKGRLLHFASRKAMNILIGEATINQMFKLGYLKNIADFYFLTKNQLLDLDGWKEKSADRFIKSLEESKMRPFANVLFALGIRYVGENTAKLLARNFRSIESLIDASQEQLLEIPEIGDTVALSVENYFSDKINLQIIDRLKSAGLRFSIGDEESFIVSDKLNNLSFVVSGLFSISRDELKKIIEQHSGKIVTTVSSSTSYLIAGDKMGPAKLEKAKKLNVSILSEKDFFDLIKK